ncbi:MAG: hypothetical protein O7D95_02970 [Betaproteobacteria bacterium]|nr:hypothetical protein [Betaproteobacteria bacterium]
MSNFILLLCRSRATMRYLQMNEGIEMSYSIVTADMQCHATRSQDTTEINVQDFLKRNTIERLAYNLKHLWAFDVRGLDDYQADAKCTFINWH